MIETYPMPDDPGPQFDTASASMVWLPERYELIPYSTIVARYARDTKRDLFLYRHRLYHTFAICEWVNADHTRFREVLVLDGHPDHPSTVLPPHEKILTAFRNVDQVRDASLRNYRDALMEKLKRQREAAERASTWVARARKALGAHHGDSPALKQTEAEIAGLLAGMETDKQEEYLKAKAQAAKPKAPIIYVPGSV